jgi:hypothetical protein
MFDHIPALAPPKRTDVSCELDRYLKTDVEHVEDPLLWWYERRSLYPCLSRMALDYLSMPGKSRSDLSCGDQWLTDMQQRQLMSNGCLAVDGFC